MKPTLLIPIYDHGATIGGVLQSLEVHGLPCLVVNDGSSPPTRKALDELEARYDWVTVHHRVRNGGRGAALKTGYRVARELGFTHAIQLDADAQHDARDVPKFIEAARARPEALVLGAPIFDASAPKARLYGRQLSRGMVWLTTFSFAVTDPLCGFRGIPLEPALRLIERSACGDHMEFDPEFVIRLQWMGVPVVNVPTQVVYDEDGVSHFDMWRDNLRLIGMYTRATLGALPARLRGVGPVETEEP